MAPEVKSISEYGRRKTFYPAGGAGGGRLLYADSLRICAALAVVTLHVSANTVMEYGRINYWDWFAGNFVDSACRWAVPLFVMLSGALLLDSGKRLEKPWTFYIKRSRRIVIPMVFWSLVCYAWYGARFAEAMRSVGAVRMIALGSHLYYLVVIAFIYSVTPWLRSWVGRARDRGASVLLFFLAVGFLNALVYYFSGSATAPVTVPTPLTFFFFSAGFIGYFVGGHYLMTCDMSGRWIQRLSPAVVFASFLVIVEGTSLLVTRYGPGRAGLCLYDYFSPPVIVMSFALFICFKMAAGSRNTEAVGAPASAIRILAEASFGVYLVHPFVQDIVRRGMDKFWMGGAMPAGPWLGIPAIAAVVFCISAAVAVFIRKINYLRAIVGG